MSEGPTDWRSGRFWNKKTLVKYLQPVIEWQKKNRVPASRIIAGEFGCNRLVSGCEQYLSDLVDIFDEHGWHWSFYSFREDTWPGMDYELGTRQLTEVEWDLLENGGTLEYTDKPASIAAMLRGKFHRSN